MKKVRGPLALLFVFACGDQLPEDHLSLESRLLAPCCYKQTLDVHSSELANEVRSLVRTKMKNGASAAEVEAELVGRYGERILAVPDRNFLRPVGIAGMGFVAIVEARSDLDAELRELD